MVNSSTAVTMVYEVRNKELYKRSELLIKELFNLLSQSIDDGMEYPIDIEHGLSIIENEPDRRSFLPVTRVVPDVLRFCVKYDKVIAELPVYISWLDWMKADDVINSQLDVVVGTPEFSYSRSPMSYLQTLFSSSILPQRLFEFDQITFDDAYYLFETFFFSDSFDFTMASPIANFDYTVPNGMDRIQLDTHLSIERISTAQLNSIYRGKTIRDPPFHYYKWCVVFRTKEKKVIGPLDGKKYIPQYHKGLEETGRVLSALRILQLGKIGIDINLTELISFGSSGFQVRGSMYKKIYMGQSYSLSTENVDEFVSLLDGINSIDYSKYPYFNTAIRWFNYSYDRERIEDRFIDLMVGYEALFLNDSGDPGYRGELSYRLSLRAAVLLGQSEEERLKIFKEIKRAYWLRSKLVHGGTVKVEIKIDEQKYPIKQFVDMIEEYLRTSLRLMINRAKDKNSTKPLIPWDNMILTCSFQP